MVKGVRTGQNRVGVGDVALRARPQAASFLNGQIVYADKMRIFCPESWPQIAGIDYSAEISLNQILPKAGQQAHAFFFSEDLPVGEVTHLLWQPPYTAINGWSEAPSEIAKSFVLTIRAGPPLKLHAHQYRYEFDVIACEPLLSKLRATPGNWTLEECLDTTKIPPKASLIWEEVSWCGVASVDGIKYVCANTSTEAHMELLMEEIDGEIHGLFSIHYDPGGEYCYLGWRKLSMNESSAVKGAMRQAVQLNDSCTDYLRA
ncbi:hypothetical protein [Pseudoduganella sp. R-43]|uniref:hypothetical protein n=1 Tax=Pseudoduganella sp. R-43 TaxID=3404063 RepID=UPI003CF8C943